ncbi:MAG: metallophosphoesterase family protein [Candidatus Baldrarchaeia archaeon]
MKIIALTDIHGHIDPIKRILKEIKKHMPDLVLICGDLTHFGPLNVARKVLSMFTKEGWRTLFVPGNCDPRELLLLKEVEGAINIHGTFYDIEEFSVIGFGGGTFFRGMTPIEFGEDEFESGLKPNFDNAKERNREIILCTHAPPRNTRIDYTLSGTHAGSDIIRRLVLEYEPLIAFHGHIHEARGVDVIGKTPCINMGPAYRGYFAVADVKRGAVDYELIELGKTG